MNRTITSIDVGDTPPKDVIRKTHISFLCMESKRLRDWIDELDEALKSDRVFIPGMLIRELQDAASSICYYSGLVNGARPNNNEKNHPPTK